MSIYVKLNPKVPNFFFFREVKTLSYPRGLYILNPFLFTSSREKLSPLDTSVPSATEVRAGANLAQKVP